MGTTLNKLQYLDETKGQIKTALNQFGSQITDEDTFRSYVDKINDIYDNWEKVTGEGTDITLNNTKKGKMSTQIKGDTQQETYNGYNKINCSMATTTISGITATHNANGTYTINGTATADVYLDICFFELPAGTYKLVGCPSGGSWANYIQYIRRVDGQAFSINDSGNGGTGEVTGNEGQLRLSILIVNGYTANNLVFKPMITTNTSLTYNDYEPYTNGASPNPTYPQDIEVVTGTQEVKVENKNLISLANATQTANGISVTFENGEIKITGTATDSTTTYFSNIVQEVANVKSGETYTYSLTSDKTNAKFRFFLGSEAGSFAQEPTYQTLLVDSSTHPTKTKTMTASGTLKLLLYCVVNAGDTFDFTIKPQLEKGSSASEFTPHQEQNYTISLGDIKLCKIPNTNYQDKIYHAINGNPIYDSLTSEQKALLNYGSWYKKEILYKIANKTNWSVDIVASNNRAVISLGGNGFPYSSDIGYATANAISNNFIGISQVNQASTTEINNIAVNNANMYIKFADTINTKELAKAQLDSMTSLEIYYVVATPQDIEITNTTLIEQLNNLENLKSYADQTNITSSYTTGNAQMIISASALKKGGN